MTYATWEEAVGSLLREPSQRQLVLDCFYDQPRSVAAERYARSPEWCAALELLPRPAGKALEVGAGHGIASCALARVGWKVTALEPDPSLLVGAGAIRGLASECGLDIRVVEAFGEQLPFGDGEFDLVLARHHGLGPMGGTELDPILRNLGITTIVGVGVSVNTGVGVTVHTAPLQPFTESQVWQGSQVTGLLPTQVPPWQVSIWVQTLPSLQPSPSGTRARG